MGDKHLGDIVSNVRAIGAILEKIFVQSAPSTPLYGVTPESATKPVQSPGRYDNWEIVTTFISRLFALEKEIDASGSGRPVSRSGENSLEKLRKGIHQAATSLGLAGRQEVVVGPQSPLANRQNSRHGFEDDMFPVAFESIDINAALLSTSVDAPSKAGGHARSSSWFGWSKSPNMDKKTTPMASPANGLNGRPPRFRRSKSDAEVTASLLHKEPADHKKPGRSNSRTERTGGGLFRKLACCVLPRGGAQVSSINYRIEPLPDSSEKLRSLLVAKLQYWDKELARLRDQAVNCGAFVRQSRLNGGCFGGPLFTNTPPTYVRVQQLADVILQTLRSGRERVVLLHGRFGMGKSLLAFDIALDLDKGLDYPGGVYFLHFGERFGAQCSEAELDTKILEQQKLLIAQMAYAGDKVSDTPGVSMVDTTQLLATKLSGKRSLLILDDVWSPKIVEHFMMAGHKGKLLVTSSYGASIGLLSDEETKKQCVGNLGASSCIMFQVGSQDYRTTQMEHRILTSFSWMKTDEEVKECATKILEACGGFPLALSIVGCMLRGKDQDEWEKLSTELVTGRTDLTNRNSESRDTPASAQPESPCQPAALTQRSDVNVASEGSVPHVRQSTFSEPSLQSFDVNSYTTASNQLKDDIKVVAEGSFLSMRSNCSELFLLNNLGVETSYTAGSLQMELGQVVDRGTVAESNSSEYWVLEPRSAPAPGDPYLTLWRLIELCLKRLSAEQLDAFNAMSLFQADCLIPAPIVELALVVTHGGLPCAEFMALMDGLVRSGLVYQSLDKRGYWVHSMISRYLIRHHADVSNSIVQVQQHRLDPDTTGQETGQLNVSNAEDKARLLNAFLLTYAHPDLKQIAVNQLGLEVSVLGGVKPDIQDMAFSMLDQNGKLELVEPARQADRVLAATLRHSGNLRTSLGDLEGALTELNRAHQLEPDDVLTLQMRGAILVHYEEYENALADVEKADKLMPDDSFTLQIRGNIKRCVDKNEEALQDLERANHLEPNKSFTLSVLGAVKLNLGDYHGALIDLDRAAYLEPNDHFILTVRGNTKLHLEDYQGALEDLDRALDKSLDRQSSHKSMSNAVLDKPADGVEDPNRSFTLSVRGAVKLSLGDLQGALADLDEANDLFPSDSFILKLRATVKLQSGDYKGSLSDLDDCCRLDPDGTDILRLRGNLKIRLGDYQGALEDFTRSNFLEPRNSYTLKFRGNVKRCLADYRGALEDLDQANELKPDNTYTSLIRAIVRAVLGDQKGALEDFNRVLHSEAASAFGLLERGVAKYLTGDLAGALLDLDRAHDIQPQSADILRHRGNVKTLLRNRRGVQADHVAANNIKPSSDLKSANLDHVPSFPGGAELLIPDEPG